MLCDTSCGKEIYRHRNNKQYDFLSKKTYVDEIEIVFCNILFCFKHKTQFPCLSLSSIQSN